jgi:hypothetical protein
LSSANNATEDVVVFVEVMVVVSPEVVVVPPLVAADVVINHTS